MSEIETLAKQRWHRLDELLAGALERQGDERDRFLDEACGTDAGLRRELEFLIGCASASADFLERPPIEAATLILSAADEKNASTRRTKLDARFVPGDVIADRYRVVGLLGRGGMGEVYRADDLKLEHPVALKFISESLSRSAAELSRFHREVSLARQISHRHVCRVYDIGEHGGTHFLSMEWVRGEDLGSLLKRVGRLPMEKAAETARQLCSGLAAIHAAGVVHRDLKPANVMIDERGDVRITDFGIAALGDSDEHREIVGTPAYMAPELLSGEKASPRSDIYALGLVLYEAFTGKRPYEARTLEDVPRVQTGRATHPRPSSWVTDLDPLVERVILRCLESEPENRPASALAIAAALPGGDPLAAALAAGETPSPQMVAAAPSPAALVPRTALFLLTWIVVALAIVIASSRHSLVALMPLDKPVAVLRSAASDFLETIGASRPFDSASGYETDEKIGNWIATRDPAAAPWARLRQAPLPVLTFWYRSSTHPLVAMAPGGVDRADPPFNSAGSSRMRFDTTGRLLSFEQIPAGMVSSRGRRAVDWSPFFRRAGVDPATLRPVPSQRVPLHAVDSQQAWEGTWPGRPDLPMRIETASYRGAPIVFELLGPWDVVNPAERSTEEVSGRPTTLILVALYFSSLVAGALLAWRNFRLGRGDRRGAFRLMLFTFVTRILLWGVVTHHVADLAEVDLLIDGLQNAVYWAALVGLLYLALEPFIRRRWPHRLISWTRVLTGNVRDPLVGRDILIGAAFGFALTVSVSLFTVLPLLLGKALPHPSHSSTLVFRYGLAGVPGFFSLLLTQLNASTLFPLILVALVLFLSIAIRSQAVGVAIVWLAVYFLGALNVGDSSTLTWLLAALPATIMLFVLIRFGLLALCVLFFVTHVWAFYPVTTHFTAWYATPFLMQLMTIAFLVLFASRSALAGRSFFSAAWLDS